MSKRAVFLFLLLLMILLPWTGSVWLDWHIAQDAWAQGEYQQAADYAAAAASRWIAPAPMWALAGRAYAVSGAPLRAEQAFQRAAAAPSALSAADWLTWGNLLWQRGDRTEALARWQQGLQEGAVSPDLLTALAYAHALRGEETAERETLRRLLALDDETAWAHFRLALWLAADGDPEALTHLRRAAALDEALAAPAESLRLALNQSLASDPPQDALLVGRALGYLNAWPQADKAFRRALQANPREGETWAWLAESHQHLGADPSIALMRALQYAPRSSLVWGMRGMYFARQKDWQQALTDFQQAVALTPDSPLWLPSLGEAWAENKNLPAALDAYRRAAALAQDEPRYWHLLGSFCLEYNIDLPGEGLDAALRAVLLNPDSSTYAVLVGRYYMALNRPEDAEKYLQRARELAPEDAQAAMYWGIWQAQYGTAEAARTALTQALRDGDDGIRLQANYWLERLP